MKSNSDFFVTGSVLTVDGNSITATALGTETDNWLLGGVFETDDSSVIQKITFHKGTTIKIARAVSALAVGDSFTARAGCDWARTTCRTKFSNELNYGGQPYLPDKNPFSGDAIM